MATKMTTRLQSFFEEQANGYLRSIVKYEQRDYEVVFLRDDVAERYSPAELEDSLDDMLMESFSAGIYENTFSDDHGDLTCMVKCFENAVEMNFVLTDGVGTAVGLDAEAMADAHGLVAEARSIVLEERD